MHHRASPRPGLEVDLARGCAWRWRLLRGQAAGRWCTSPTTALAALGPPRRVSWWPRTWVAFAAPDGARIDEQSLPGLLRHGVPAALAVGRVRVASRPLSVMRGVVDLAAALCGEPREGRACWLSAAVDVPRDSPIRVHAGADWRMAWYVDGHPVFDTLALGNGGPLAGQAHGFDLALDAGVHHLAVLVLSGAGGWGFASCATDGRILEHAHARLEARLPLRCVRTARFAALSFVGPEGEDAGRPLLDGRPLPVPVPGMCYARVDGIAPGRVRTGSVLHRSWSVEETAAAARVAQVRPFSGSGSDRRARIAGRLLGVLATAADIRTGPFLVVRGDGGTDLVCRTTAPVPLLCRGRGWRCASPIGLVHRISLPAGACGRISLDLPSGRAVHRQVLAPAPGEPWRIAVLSDPSPQPRVLARAARAAARLRPHAALLLGDLVAGGMRDQAWDVELSRPLAPLAARARILAVIGNHDEASPVWDALFGASHGGRVWSAALGPLRVVGIDGLADLESPSLRRRLERMLAATQEPFLAVAVHYPPWTSTGHGRTGADGRPVQKGVRHAREIVLPLARRHQATVVLCGHAHAYERSCTADGDAIITVGGAGGYLYPALPGLNPFSCVFASVHHHAQIEVDSQHLRLRAVALDGRLLDEVVFAPRGIG